MKTFMRLGARIPGVVLAVYIGLAAAVAETKTADVVSAADKFLATLTPEQQQKVLYRFDDQTQRAHWSNLPTGFVPRGGISLKQMSAPQRAAATNLLAVVLSPMGLEKVNEIREADDDFKLNGSRRGPGGRGGRPPAGPPPGGRAGRRHQAVLADQVDPSPATICSEAVCITFRFSANLRRPLLDASVRRPPSCVKHHDCWEQAALTPSLTAAQPATFSLNGKTIRPVGRESDKALALLQSLDPNQRKQTVLTYSVTDLVLGPGQDGKTIAPEGLKASALNPKQQAMLLDLIEEWAGIINQTSANRRMAQVKTELNETWFAWSGPTSAEPGSNITAYYRIQGPHLVIEYAPQRDEPNNHVHTIYRDPTNDYGSALVKQ